MNEVKLPPCKEEDSHNCEWNAQTQGNGSGLSFTDVNGVVTYHLPNCDDAYAGTGTPIDAQANCWVIVPDQPAFGMFNFDGHTVEFDVPTYAHVTGVWVREDLIGKDTYVPTHWWGLDLESNPVTHTIQVHDDALANTGVPAYMLPGLYAASGVALALAFVGGALLLRRLNARKAR